MKEKTFIYALLDPRNNSVRYVGKANDPIERFKNHINSSRDKNTHKRNWINELILSGNKPELLILDKIPITEWRFWEIFYIDLFKYYGFNLVNHTNGGDGATYGNSTSYKKGMIPLNKGIPMSEKTKNKIREKIGGIPNLVCSKPIIRLDKNYNILERYTSGDDAARKSNGYYLNSKISLCCRGLRNEHRGFIWVFDDGREIDKTEKIKGRKKGKAILKYDTNSVFIERFISIKLASESIGVSSTSIINVIKELKKTSGGYLWKYEN